MGSVASPIKSALAAVTAKAGGHINKVLTPIRREKKMQGANLIDKFKDSGLLPIVEKSDSSLSTLLYFGA